MPIEIAIPTLHAGQVRIWNERAKFNAVRCGRRWGKTKNLVTLAADAAAKGRKAGVFTPEHRQLSEPYSEILYALNPIKDRASKTEGTIRTITGGVVDFWPLNDNELAGRGREYDLILMDEAAYTKPGQMLDVWRKSIRPTMLTRPKATTWVFSTPNGNDPENFFWKICNDPELGFVSHYAPSEESPFITTEELERHRIGNSPHVFRQEYLAEFVDWSGDAFFAVDKLLVDGEPVEYPKICDSVFAVIDSAVKGGRDHDGTAVSYWARSRFIGHPLVCLDWDIVQIDGAMLEAWIPSVFRRLDDLTREIKTRQGSKGVYIEDAQSGSILLQQCANRGYRASPLPSRLTAAGKDARAINASGPIYRGEVKFSRHAFEKKDVTFKGVTRNHMVDQIIGFHVGDKAAASRADDALDTFCYAIAITLGDEDGVA